MASNYDLDGVIPPPRNPQRQQPQSSYRAFESNPQPSPTVDSFGDDDQLGTGFPQISAQNRSQNSNLTYWNESSYSGTPTSSHYPSPATPNSRSRTVSVSSMRTLGASGLPGSPLGDHGSLPPLPPLPISVPSSGSLKTTIRLVPQQQQHILYQAYQQFQNFPDTCFHQQGPPLSTSPPHVSPTSPQYPPASSLTPLSTTLTHASSPSLASPTSFYTSLASPYTTFSSASFVSAASTPHSSVGTTRKNSFKNIHTSKASYPASISSSSRSSLSSSSNSHNHNNSFSYPTGYFSDSDNTSYYSYSSGKRIPSPETAIMDGTTNSNLHINNSNTARAKKGSQSGVPGTFSPPVTADLYQGVPATPPLRLKSSNKSLKATQNGKGVKLPPIKTEVPMSHTFTSPLSPRSSSGGSGSRLRTGHNSVVSPTTPSSAYTFANPSKFFKSNNSQQQQFPLVNEVGNNAKYYQDNDVKNKLRLLVSSSAKFDEFIEFGFPIHLAPADLALIGVSEAVEKNVQLDSPVGMIFDEDNRLSASSIEKIKEGYDLHEQKIEVEGSTFTNRQLSMYHTSSTGSPLMSPVSTVPREMTLKFTLTPSSMRADEAVIYGWQTSGNVDFLDTEEEGAVPGVSAVSTQAPLVQNGSGDVTIITDSAAVSSAIPVGGLGKDSSGSMMKRVFGKLKKNKPNSSSVMITSADLN